jgi:hypothetical protein
LEQRKIRILDWNLIGFFFYKALWNKELSSYRSHEIPKKRLNSWEFLRIQMSLKLIEKISHMTYYS